MTGAFAALAFAPGLAVGSFLNVVAARVPQRRSIVRPPSACPACATEIAWHDNVPVLSWLMLRGRCRSCSVAIPARYPLVELGTAVLVAACVVRFGLTPDAAVGAFFCAVLVAISAIDAEHRIIPNRIVLPATVVVLVAQTALHPSLQWIGGALGASAFLLAAALAYPGGMGEGDIKLALLLGAMLGASVTVALMIGLFAALVPAAVLVSRHGSSARKMGVPLVPFLAFGSVVALFFGDAILDAYLGLF